MSISCYNTKSVIEIIMASIMLLVLVGVFSNRIIQQKGMGARIIQFTCVSLLIPMIIILAIEGVLKGETVATLIGGMAGYVLSGISNYDNDRAKNGKSGDSSFDEP